MKNGRLREALSLISILACSTLSAFFFAHCASPGSPDTALEGDPEEALTEGDFSKAIQLLNEKRQKNPEDSEVTYQLGRAYYMMGEAFAADPELGGDPGAAFQDAGTFFQKTLDLDGKHPEAGWMLAKALYMNGAVEEAYQVIQEALETQPSSAKILDTAGQITLTLSRQSSPEEGSPYLEEAIEPLRLAIRIDPGLAEGYLHLGDAYLSQGDLPLALGTYKKGIQACPEFNGLHDRLFNLKDVEGGIEPSDAIAFYNDLIASQTSRTPLGDALIRWYLGSWYDEKGSLAIGDGVASLAGKAYGKQVECLMDSAEKYPSLLDEAKEKAALARFKRGWCDLKLERFEEAEEDMFSILDYYPELEVAAYYKLQKSFRGIIQIKT